MKRWIVCFVGVLTSALVSGCSKPADIYGQVFVARQDRETVRLSGVPVVLGDSVMSNQISAVFAQAEAKQKEMETKVADAAKRYDLIEAREKELLKEEKAAHEKVFDLETEISTKKNDIENSAFAMARMTSAQRRDQVKINQALNAEIIKLKEEKLPPLKEKLVSTRQAGVEAARQREKIVQELKDLREQLQNLEVFERAIFNVPLNGGIAETMTDADGRFHFKANLADNPVLIVRTSRKVPLSGTEHYFWMEPVTRTNVILSNLNLKRRYNEKEEDGEN